jgi:hypothetical protein
VIPNIFARTITLVGNFNCYFRVVRPTSGCQHYRHRINQAIFFKIIISACIYTIKTVVNVVKNIDESREIYEDCLGLQCVDETETSVSEIGELWGIEKGSFRIARFTREGEDFGCIEPVENTAINFYVGKHR